MKNTNLEEQLLVKLLSNQVIFKKLYLVKMCPIFDSLPPVFGERYQSFLRVCWFLHKGVLIFGYPSKNLSNPTDINVDHSMPIFDRNSKAAATPKIVLPYLVFDLPPAL